MVAYVCNHLLDNLVDLSDIYVDLSDLYIDLSLIHFSPWGPGMTRIGPLHPLECLMRRLNGATCLPWLYVQANEPPLYLRRLKLTLQYFVKL